MLLNSSSDQTLFQETTSKFLDELASPDELRALRDDERGFDAAYWRRGAELGWTSLLVPDALGGGSIGEHGLVDLTLIAYEFGRHAAPGPLLSTNVVVALLARAGARTDVVDALLTGTATAAWCRVEAPPHDRREAWSTEVRVEGGEVVVSGVKRPVDNAATADHLLVTGRSGNGLTNVLVPSDAAGVDVTPLRTTDLTRRFGSVRFDDVRVPMSAVVGEVGGADADVDWAVDVGVVLTTAESVGAMQAALDMTVEWAFDRYTFGRPLASYQALKHRFADMTAWLQAAHAISDAAADAVAHDRSDAAELVCAAAAFIGDHGTDLAHECVQIHGGIGVTFEHDLHLFLRRLVVNRSLYGSPTEHRLRLADILEAHDRGEEQR